MSATAPESPRSLTEMLDVIEHGAGRADRVALNDVLEAVGRRSFAPLLLVSGLLALLLGGIPGVPTVVGILVGLTAAQLLLGRKSFWLPGWLKRRSISRAHLRDAMRWIRPPARWVDRWTHPRWTGLTRGAGRYAVAALTLLIAVTLPPMELVPFSSHIIGAALTVFGVALITHDGVAELAGLLLTIATAGVVIYGVLA